MIIDCFTFFNELDLLELRLEELNPIVDKFILVEATKTQSLLDKPLYFEINKNRYSKFLNKIIHIVVDEKIDNSQNLWTMENYQRNCILNGLNKISDLSTEDWILISDLDEIPKCAILKQLNTINTRICSLNMIFSAYYMNLVASSRTWIGTVCVKANILEQYNPQNLRSSKDNLPIIQNAGWHFSWLGGYEKVYQKAMSCIEPFDKSQIPDKETFHTYFTDFINSKEKFFIHIENLSKKETEFKKIEIDNSFPEYLISNLDQYKEYIL